MPAEVSNSYLFSMQLYLNHVADMIENVLPWILEAGLTSVRSKVRNPLADCPAYFL